LQTGDPSALRPGEVTDPLTIPNGPLALFQLPRIEETNVTAPTYSAIEYATYYNPADG